MVHEDGDVVPCCRIDAIMGNLQRDFDFNQRPRRPMLLPTIPAGKLLPWPFPGVHN